MRRPSSSSVKVFYPRYSRPELLDRLARGVQALAEVLPLELVVLFGSYAAGRQTAASDVDLLVVYAGAPRADAYSLVRRVLDLRGLEPHVYAEEEARALWPTLERMIRGGVQVYSRSQPP